MFPFPAKLKGTHQEVRKIWNDVFHCYLNGHVSYRQKLGLFQRMVLILTILRDPRTRNLSMLTVSLDDIMYLLSKEADQTERMQLALESLDSSIDAVLLAASGRRRSFTRIPSVISDDKTYEEFDIIYLDEETEREVVPEIDDKTTTTGTSWSVLDEKSNGSIIETEVTTEGLPGETEEAKKLSEDAEGAEVKPDVTEEEKITVMEESLYSDVSTYKEEDSEDKSTIHSEVEKESEATSEKVEQQQPEATDEEGNKLEEGVAAVVTQQEGQEDHKTPQEEDKHDSEEATPREHEGEEEKESGVVFTEDQQQQEDDKADKHGKKKDTKKSGKKGQGERKQSVRKGSKRVSEEAAALGEKSRGSVKKKSSRKSKDSIKEDVAEPVAQQKEETAPPQS